MGAAGRRPGAQEVKDLREGLPEEWTMVPGMLFMINPMEIENANVLFGPSYVYLYRECENCGHKASIPWPLKRGVTSMCRKCGMEHV